MNEREVAEIRRRFRGDKSSITHVHGCYVNEKGEIVSQFNQSLALMSQEESERFLGILKRTLSGGIGKNLIDITFSTQQVVDSEEHKLLMELRNSSLNHTEAVQAFYERAIQSITLEGNYLIMLTCDTYDVPYRAKDGAVQGEASSEVFHYILCSVCPVKLTKPALSYFVHENQFHSRQADWVVSAPEFGFLFPAFDDRSTNLYNALYYTKDTTQNHSEFVDAVFHSEIPMPAAVQKETFQTILGDVLAEDCSYEVVHAVNEQLCELIEEHKVNKVPQPLVISKDVVKQVLSSSGVAEQSVIAFEEKFEEEFGRDVDLSPRNLVDEKRVEVRTPDVTIHVAPERGDLIQTRVIDGTKYILIRADGDVEVNGVSIQIS